MARFTPMIAVMLIAWMMLLTIISAYYVFTMNRDETRDLDYDDDDMPDEFAFARRTRINHLLQEPYENERGKRLNTLHAAAELDLENRKHKNDRTDFEDVKLLSSLLPHIKNITRMPTPTPHTFLNYIAPVGLPVIFTDMLVGTKLAHWSWDMVKENWGDTIFGNTRQGNLSSKTNKHGKQYVNRVSVRLSEFVDVVTGKKDPGEKEKLLYITKQRVLPPQSIREYFVYPPFYPGNNEKCYLEPTGWYVADHYS